jgi:hypothetical protein
MPAPSSEMNPVAERTSPPSRKRCLTPRRSPLPSSPTVAANRMGKSVVKSASVRDLARASKADSPRPSSAIPGPLSTLPSFRTVRSVPEGKTVSRWAAITTGGSGLVAGPQSDDVSNLIGSHIFESRLLEEDGHAFSAGNLSEWPPPGFP